MKILFCIIKIFPFTKMTFVLHIYLQIDVYYKSNDFILFKIVIHFFYLVISSCYIVLKEAASRRDDDIVQISLNIIQTMLFFFSIMCSFYLVNRPNRIENCARHPCLAKWEKTVVLGMWEWDSQSIQITVTATLLSWLKEHGMVG